MFDGEIKSADVGAQKKVKRKCSGGKQVWEGMGGSYTYIGSFVIPHIHVLGILHVNYYVNVRKCQKMSDDANKYPSPLPNFHHCPSTRPHQTPALNHLKPTD